MDQIFFVRIVAEALLVLIPGATFIGIILVPLITGKTKRWFRSASGNKTLNSRLKEKWKNNYDEKKHVLVVSRKDLAKEYWSGIFFNVMFFIVITVVAFIVYQKIKFL